MAVYVDSMKAKYGRMVMCHLFADSTEELLDAADRIGVARKWIQHAGEAGEHFDVCLSKRRAAIAAGARVITARQAGELILARRGRGDVLHE